MKTAAHMPPHDTPATHGPRFRAPRMTVLRSKLGTETRRVKLDRLLEQASGHGRALVLTHDNPDPDSMASAVALAHLLEKLAGIPAVVAYGGIVGRAENRAMVRVLKLQAVPVSRVVFEDDDLICMVDTQPE